MAEIHLNIKGRYFFDDGIRFQCQRCGACCNGPPGTVFVDSTEISVIAGHLGMARDDFIARCLFPYKESYSIREKDDGACLFYDKGCTLYAVRPLQCRAFPFWFDIIRSKDRWDAVRRECPGIGKGSLYTREQILAIVQQTMKF